MIKVTHYMRKPCEHTHSLERLFADIRDHMPASIQVTVCESRFISMGLFSRLYDIFRSIRYQGDINHITGDVHFITYLLTRKKTILTIHDCVMLERLCGWRYRALWFFWYWLPVRRSTVVTVISESTRQQLLHYLSCNPDKIVVIPNCVSDEFKPSPKNFNQELPRLLHLGTAPNKNLERVAAALEGIRCELVIIGRLSDPLKAILARHNIRYTNYVDISREALLAQYQACDMVVFPSTYEGFGLPIIEANAVGRPVLTSNLFSMPAVAGTAACIVDPFDVSAIRSGILKILQNPDYREELVGNGYENVKRFTPKAVAALYADLYQRIYNRNQGI